MSTRDEILRAAGEHGWFPVPHMTGRWVDTFERVPQLDATDPLVQIARLMGWELTEQVMVVYTDGGTICEAHVRTPAQQAVMDGHFLGVEDRVRARTRGKKTIVLTWISRSAWTFANWE